MHPLHPVYFKEGRLYLIEQRLLPAEERHLAYDDAGSVAKAIQDMVVRGAPAIGIAAAYGMALAARQARRRGARPSGARPRSTRPLAAKPLGRPR